LSGGAALLGCAAGGNGRPLGGRPVL